MSRLPLRSASALRCHHSTSRMTPFAYTSELPAEPLENYKSGGYHPVCLGDTFKQGRYKILHKLGWGGYSTTWLARDNSNHRNVALKVCSAFDHTRERTESQILQALPAHHHIVQLLDSFAADGPNGTHSCLVLELLGPSIFEVHRNIQGYHRLPAPIVKKTAAQVLRGIQLISNNGWGHGDLHTNNVAFRIPNLDRLPEQEILKLYRRPFTGAVKRTDGGSMSNQVPPYLVLAPYLDNRVVIQALETDPAIKIIDFGEAFTIHTVSFSSSLNTSLLVRSPEVIFHDKPTPKVDIWAMGCMLFELATGQPLFESMRKEDLISEMISLGIDRLPSSWEKKWNAMMPASSNSDGHDDENPQYSLREWLEEVYSSPIEKDHASFSERDLSEICRLMGKMMRFKPGDRAEASELLADPWFRT